MISMPYKPGCAKCDAVRDYFRRINRAVDESVPRRGGPFMVGVTLDAAEVPMCPEHLEHLGEEDD